MTVLVTGTTGNVGAEVVGALVAAGSPVRGLVRGIPAGLPLGVQYAVGDLNEPHSFGPALYQARGLFLLPGFRHTPELLEVAVRSGVERVVLLSGPSAGSGDLTNAVTRYMVESEQAVRASGLAWTILRPSGFMSNTLQWSAQLAAGDVVRVPFAQVPIANVDPYDIAAVAVAALLQDGHQGAVHRLTGPRALLPADRLAVLGAVLGRDLRLEAQSDDEARAEMSRTTPVEYVDAFFDFYVAGSLDDSQVNSTVQEVTGRPARTFEQWAAAHAGSFR
ncbi:NAD(P)H-binding protein [Nonomuraea sp. NPDC050404]|uniref:NAD(P)H-binding protein n=1 Tax=Nonomuraea sp. NPDC050404 TaxID=3155783 RepID=UPI0033E0DCD1